MRMRSAWLWKSGSLPPSPASTAVDDAVREWILAAEAGRADVAGRLFTEADAVRRLASTAGCSAAGNRPLTFGPTLLRVRVVTSRFIGSGTMQSD
jgi:hypothetical protein